MGYTTNFEGQFDLDRPLAPEHLKYLTRFNDTRRMRREALVAACLPDPVRIAAGLPIGKEGGYYVGSDGNGQGRDASIQDSNAPPVGQPGLWCGWVPAEDGTAIIWDGGEKFYEYIDWIEYLIEHFLKPWGYHLNGEIIWKGEDLSDVGTIIIVDNVVTSSQR